MNKNNIKETIRLALWDTVEDHPAAIIASFTIIGAFPVALILTSPVLTILATILIILLPILLPPIILIVSFIRNYRWYKERSRND